MACSRQRLACVGSLAPVLVPRLGARLTTAHRLLTAGLTAGSGDKKYLLPMTYVRHVPAFGSAPGACFPRLGFNLSRQDGAPRIL